MKPLEIDPWVGVGPLRFGMSRSEVRKLFGAYEEFHKTLDSVLTTDDFREPRMHVYYRKDGVVEVADAVEVMSEANPSFRGHLLGERPLAEVAAIFRQVDSDFEVDSSGLDVPDLGISVYAPEDCLAEEGADPRLVQAVYVHSRRNPN